MDYPLRHCHGCELPVITPPVQRGKNAYCPRCGTQLYRGGQPSFSGNLALALTCLILFIPAYGFDFLSIHLLGSELKASVFLGVFSLFQSGFPIVAGLVLFCGVIAPFAMCSSVVLAHTALYYRHHRLLILALKLMERLRIWSMIDVFLVSVVVACFKLRDYADIFVSPALYGFILLQILSVILMGRISVRRYWEKWQSESTYDEANGENYCSHCHLSQNNHEFCIRCSTSLLPGKRNSIQKTWALLTAAAICIFPANLLPMSILFSSGKRLEDTIFSGVVNLIQLNMAEIAVVIFVASILVPAIKIIGLAYLLIATQFSAHSYQRQRMFLYFLLKWIGKWSMIDLFVIAIMLTLVDRGQLLDFTPGTGATAFALVVIFTMLATTQFDPRLIWETENKTTAGDVYE
ncbi:paraquat-inducible protein A [Vibrio mangrovi]|nr:paraquat-inducible protein A [Vibrio mangrovi]MDW6003929.1 paraquat-inducible protein A [Vibrio mangrovi]